MTVAGVNIFPYGYNGNDDENYDLLCASETILTSIEKTSKNDNANFGMRCYYPPLLLQTPFCIWFLFDHNVVDSIKVFDNKGYPVSIKVKDVSRCQKTAHIPLTKKRALKINGLPVPAYVFLVFSNNVLFTIGSATSIYLYWRLYWDKTFSNCYSKIISIQNIFSMC